MSEATEQAAFFQWLQVQINLGYPQAEALAHLFAIPNGELRKPSIAARLKLQGVRPGVPDLFLPVPRGTYHGMWIEMKSGRNRPTDEQREWLGYLARQHYKTVVAYGWEEARDRLMEYLELDHAD